MNQTDRDGLAKIISDLTDKGFWKNINASEFRNACAIWMQEDADANHPDIHIGKSCHDYSFPAEDWKKLAQGVTDGQ